MSTSKKLFQQVHSTIHGKQALFEYSDYVFVTADKVSVLDFTAKWCGPCKMIAPEYAKMSVEFPKVGLWWSCVLNLLVDSSSLLASTARYSRMQHQE